MATTAPPSLRTTAARGSRGSAASQSPCASPVLSKNRRLLAKADAAQSEKICDLEARVIMLERNTQGRIQELEARVLTLENNERQRARDFQASICDLEASIHTLERAAVDREYTHAAECAILRRDVLKLIKRAPGRKRRPRERVEKGSRTLETTSGDPSRDTRGDNLNTKKTANHLGETLSAP